MNFPLDKGPSPSWEKRGASGGHGTYSKRFLSALTAHVCAPGTLAMAMDTPFLKGSVFEEGTVSGFVPCKVISSKPRSNLLSQIYVIQPIPRFDPHGRTRGCSSEQLYSSSDAVGAPQLDL